VIFHPEALEEFNEAAIYYEEQSAGLGFRFVDAIESGFRQIERSPITWRCIRGNIRRFLVKTFPFGIVYAPIENEIFVLAIMHLKRDPDDWLGRVGDVPPPPGEFVQQLFQQLSFSRCYRCASGACALLAAIGMT